MRSVVLVDGRGAQRTLTDLGIKCDAREIPDFASGTKPTGWWIIADCLFEGKAAFGGGEATPPGGPEVDITVTGPAAIAVGESRVIGILGPDDKADPALWWSLELSDLTVETSGTQGFLKKRPARILLRAPAGTFDLNNVSRLYRNSGSFQSGQEGSLLRALGH